MLIDTHCHLDMMIHISEFKSLNQDSFKKIQNIVDQAHAWDVTKIINIGTTANNSQISVALAQHFDAIWATVGIHPTDCTNTWKEDIKTLTKLLENQPHKIVAIGEVGLDFYRPGYNKQLQTDAFKSQIELALTHQLPLVIHTRHAFDETLACLSTYKNEKLTGVIHCFSGNLVDAQETIKLGFYLGIGGTITYPTNHALRDIVQRLGLSHIMLETDAPFLPPQIIRGKQNHPQYIKTVAAYLSHMLSLPYEEVAHITTKNAEKIFNMGNIKNS